jgi:hypothetical protein
MNSKNQQQLVIPRSRAGPLRSRPDFADLLWEWADAPQYDEKFSALAFRIVSNYVVYAMTH